MPDQKLDAETEARIREACGAISTRKPFTTWHPQEVHELLAVFIRGAIKADREARETKLRCEVVMCSGCEAILDVTLMHVTVDGDVGAFITQTEPGKMPAERAHADALAEALRNIVNEAGLEFSDPRVGYETWQLDPGVIERGREVLAAHDARRGK